MAIISNATGRFELAEPANAAIAYRPPDLYDRAGRWHYVDPSVDRTNQPYRDDDTIALADELIDSLITMRSGSIYDGGAQLSVIASLIAELDSRLPEAVFEASDQAYTWGEIASRLAMAESTVRRHYRDYVTCRKEMPFDDLD